MGKLNWRRVKSPLRDTVKKRFTNSMPTYAHRTISRTSAESTKKHNFSQENTIFHKIKQSIKSFLWQREGGYPETWFSLPSIAPKLYGPFVKLEKATTTSDESKSYCLGNIYSLTFDGVEKPILAELDEEAVYHSIYCDERLFHAIGIEGCVTINIALAKGGTEAVVESFYSVMKSQQCTGGQSNEVLALR